VGDRGLFESEPFVFSFWLSTHVRKLGVVAHTHFFAVFLLDGVRPVESNLREHSAIERVSADAARLCISRRIAGRNGRRFCRCAFGQRVCGSLGDDWASSVGPASCLARYVLVGLDMLGCLFFLLTHSAPSATEHRWLEAIQLCEQLYGSKELSLGLPLDSVSRQAIVGER
jgi:hypothetical protein